MAIGYLWRRFRCVHGKPTFLGFEGPILCTLLLLLVPAQTGHWSLLLLPWVFHFGTWIALRAGVLRLHAAIARKRKPS
jgi:hypothetical protein